MSGERRIIPMKKSITKKAKKAIEKGFEELRSMSSLERITRIGAKLMLQVAVEEEVAAYLQRDYYERNECANGNRSGSKPRTIKVGSGDIEIEMSQ